MCATAQTTLIIDSMVLLSEIKLPRGRHCPITSRRHNWALLETVTPFVLESICSLKGLLRCTSDMLDGKHVLTNDDAQAIRFFSKQRTASQCAARG